MNLAVFWTHPQGAGNVGVFVMMHILFVRQEENETVCTQQWDASSYETALLPSAVNRDCPAVKLTWKPSSNQSSLIDRL